MDISLSPSELLLTMGILISGSAIHFVELEFILVTRPNLIQSLLNTPIAVLNESL